MTGRERVLAAFSPAGAARFGAVICYEDIFVRDHVHSVSPSPWWYRVSPDLGQRLAWYEGYFARPVSDWYAVPASPPRAERAQQAIEVTAEGAFLQDLRKGTRRRLEPPAIAGQDQYERSYPRGLDGSRPPFPETAAALEQAIRPPAGDGGLPADGERDLADLLRRGPAAGLVPIAHTATPLWLCLSRWNTAETLTRCATDPDLILAACQLLMPAIEWSVSRARALGAEVVWIEECLTDLISPALFARLNAPFVRRVTDRIRAAGMKSVYYYCGNPMDRLEKLLECGADALAFEESKKAFRIEIGDLAARVAGRCVLFGNLDSIGVLQEGSDARLRQEIARQREAGERNGGRFVFSLGSPVTPATPVERVRLYHALATGDG